MRDHAADIRALRKQSNAAIDARDPDYVVSFMTDDVVVTVARGPVLTGRIANRDAFAAQMDEKGFGGYRRSPVLVIVDADGTGATENGTWVGRWRVGARAHEQRGSYTAQWRLTDVGWMIASETYREEA
jgi:ketosteroid isomerase-like protein